MFDGSGGTGWPGRGSSRELAWEMSSECSWGKVLTPIVPVAGHIFSRRLVLPSYKMLLAHRDPAVHDGMARALLLICVPAEERNEVHRRSDPAAVSRCACVLP